MKKFDKYVVYNSCWLALIINGVVLICGWLAGWADETETTETLVWMAVYIVVIV